MGGKIIRGAGIPDEVLSRAAEDFRKRQDFWKRIRDNRVYHIEDWGIITMVPGGSYHTRIHYIFDFDERKAFVLGVDKKIKFVSDEKEINRLADIVKNAPNFFNKGVYCRKLRLDEYSILFNLIIIMNAEMDLAKAKLSAGKERQRERREAAYLWKIFNIIISTR